MTPRHNPRRIANSIGVRISAACWLVTLLTLVLYVAASLPQQKRELFDSLRSKAQSVSLSLQEVTAGAAMSEDYSAVVDHSTQVLEGDPAIEYLVISKQGGFSVIVEKHKWRVETLDRFWNSAGQEGTAEIAWVPLAGKRVFHYSRPYYYSGIRWGWVNVGLSTVSYDQSVARVHQRSALLAVLAAALSLLISFSQARRLVRPIVTLQGVVRQVAGGDLSARANLEGGDEVEDLAQSFNGMADTILERNRILESVRFAGQQLLRADDWTGIAGEVLAKFGTAAGAERVYLLENCGAAEGGGVCRRRYEWAAPEGGCSPPGCGDGPVEKGAFDELAPRLAAGEMVVTESACGAAGGRRHTAVLAPIRVGEGWWGVLGLEEHMGRHQWEGAEKDSLCAVADMFGAAITRQRAQQALVEAKDNLEQRVLERTRELQEQVRAKEAANAQLAEAQHRLMELSRQAGMAEVATGVLHNVGNVLNSVNVSATIVANKVRESRLGNLLALARMLEEHSCDLPEFLNRDPKGQRVVPYLSKLGTHLEEERKVISSELELLTGHVGHIKEIVATQQSYAKVSGLIEVISLPDLVRDAVRIAQPGLERHKIQLELDFEEIPPVSMDKHAVLQIVLNLLRNAKQAVKDSENRAGRITIRVARHGEDRMRLSVSDTGVGLPPENLTRIFSHGFTTRRDGHGFGLHSGANAARQMGGSLWAESAGEGLGATFTLELPLKAALREEAA